MARTKDVAKHAKLGEFWEFFFSWVEKHWQRALDGEKFEWADIAAAMWCDGSAPATKRSARQKATAAEKLARARNPKVNTKPPDPPDWDDLVRVSDQERGLFYILSKKLRTNRQLGLPLQACNALLSAAGYRDRPLMPDMARDRDLYFVTAAADDPKLLEQLDEWKEERPDTIWIGDQDTRCRFFPKDLWFLRCGVPRRSREFYDYGERQTVRVEWPADAPIDIDMVKCEEELAELARSFKEQSTRDRASRALETLETGGGQIGYPRLCAPIRQLDTDSGRALEIVFAPSVYGLHMLSQYKLTEHLASTRPHVGQYWFGSLGVRVAYTFCHPPGSDRVWCLFHQRKGRTNSDYAEAWDVGAGGYINQTKHTEGGRLSFSRAAKCEVEEELRIKWNLQPTEEKIRFFGVAQSVLTGTMCLAGDAMAEAALVPSEEKLNRLLEDVPEHKRRVLRIEKCELTPDRIAEFLDKKDYWVNEALIVIALALEAYGHDRQHIASAFRDKIRIPLITDPWAGPEVIKARRAARQKISG